MAEDDSRNLLGDLAPEGAPLYTRPRSMPRPTLPNPSGPTENGRLPCNVPLDGVPGVYCDRLVKHNGDGSSKGHRRHPHRFQWRDRG